MNKLSVVLADDHDIVREGLKKMLSEYGNITIVAEAANGRDVIKRVEEYKPDLAILDIQMPQMLGIDAVTHIKQSVPSCKVIVLSMFQLNQYIRTALANGASAYLLKSSAVSELKTAIDFVLRGEIYLSPLIAKNVVKDWLNGSEKTDEEHSDGLTPREKQVLKMLAEGYSNKKIGELLHISHKTVETHRYRINEKLDLGNITDLVKYAIKENLIAIE